MRVIHLVGLLIALAINVCSEIAPGWSAQQTGTVSGRIAVSGTVPQLKPLPVFKSRTYCGPTVANETLLVSRAGGLKNSVVILRSSTPVPLETVPPLVLDNKRCAFAPHVQVAWVGSELLLKNSDPILHTVHARMGRETLFNVGLPRWRQVSKRLDRAGVIRIDCDVLHTWMSAAIVVSDSPFVALSDDKGEFHIGGLPPGDYEMEIWHERLGAQRQKISLGENSVRTVEVVYSAEKIR